MIGKKISQLLVTELRRELEELDLDTTGSKAVLLARLKGHYENQGIDPETVEFEDPSMKTMTLIRDEISQKMSSISNELFQEVSSLSMEISSLSAEMFSQRDEISRKVSQQEGRIAGIEEEMQKLQNIVSHPPRPVCREGEPNPQVERLESSLSTLEIKLQAMEERFSDHTSRGELRQESNTAGETKARLKPPTFDGTTSWPNYLKQFNAAASANGWCSREKAVALTVALRGDALDVLQTLHADESEDFDQLVKRLEMRYGQAHLEQVYQYRLKNRRQKAGESIQEFEAEVARMVRFAYSSANESILECLAVQAFIDG